MITNAAEPNRLRLLHWAVPAVVLLLTAPVWIRGHDAELFYALNRHLAVVPDGVWAFLSLLGTGWAIYALTAPSLWLGPRVLLSWLCAAPVAGVVTRIGKMVANNPRPLEVLGPEGIHLIGEPLFIAAMPSGHTITGFAAATALYFALTRGPLPWGQWRISKALTHTLLATLLFGVATGVGLSRVAVGAHWPADVCVGAALGILSGLTGVVLCQRISDRFLTHHSWVLRGVALFGAYCLYVLLTDPMGFDINQSSQEVLSAVLALCLLRFLWKTCSKPPT
jgi:membrane-associated phospholipid phosphatase